MVSASCLVGEEDWPPGFRFHPTDEELVVYYLKRKICGKKLRLDVIAETDVYKWDPEELPGLSLIRSGDRQWFFFTPRDRKYPNGARSNRATTQGYWKATGKDRSITCGSRSVGLKKTLVFYRGRAPNGERTDWVMHEYTLDEEELKRCQDVQEYFALYKVYKKSGAGPKNGEQYGAPFREENWNFDCPDFNNSASRDIPVEKVDEALPNGGAKVDCEAPTLSDDMDEVLKNLIEEPLPDVPVTINYNHTPAQVLSHEDVQISRVVDLCINHEPVNVLYGNGVQRNLQVSFNLSQLTDPQVQLYEEPKVESAATKIDEQEFFSLPEEDFLEMDDLLGPDLLNNVDAGEPLNGIMVNEPNALCDLDMFHDAAMFLCDIGANHCEAVNHYDYNLNPNQIGSGSVIDQLYVEASSEVVNQPYLGGADPINQLYPSTANQINNQPYPDETSVSYAQEGSVLTSVEFYGEQYPDPTSVYGSSNNSLQANQNQGGDDGNGATSWFSSAMWSFVESIPTTPASAAENALVNRAFTRMSSFSRLKLNMTSANVTPVSDSETVKSSCSKRGFILFPVLVAVIAVSWGVLGAVNVWGT